MIKHHSNMEQTLYNIANPKLAPNLSSDVKVVEVTPYQGVNGTGSLFKEVLVYHKVFNN